MGRSGDEKIGKTETLESGGLAQALSCAKYVYYGSIASYYLQSVGQGHQGAQLDNTAKETTGNLRHSRLRADNHSSSGEKTGFPGTDVLTPWFPAPAGPCQVCP